MLILKDIEAYYDDPVHWFSAKERSHWDGAEKKPFPKRGRARELKSGQ
jgi:hypothetical protein